MPLPTDRGAIGALGLMGAASACAGAKLMSAAMVVVASTRGGSALRDMS